MADVEISKVPEVPFRVLITKVFGDTKVEGFFGKKKQYISEKFVDYQYYDKEKGWLSIPTEYEFKEIESK